MYQPNDEQLAALRAFAVANGHNWKSRLMTAWTHGYDINEPHGRLLRQLRNQLGPGWLADFNLEN